MSCHWHRLWAGSREKLTVQPSHSSYSAFFHLTHCDRYKLHMTLARLVGVSMHELLRCFGIKVLYIITFGFLSVSPQNIIQPTCNLQLIRSVRDIKSAFAYCCCFMKLLFIYPEYVDVYGSYVQSLTGSTFIYDNQIFSYHLHSCNSIYIYRPLHLAATSAVYPPMLGLTEYLNRLLVAVFSLLCLSFKMNGVFERAENCELWKCPYSIQAWWSASTCVGGSKFMITLLWIRHTCFDIDICCLESMLIFHLLHFNILPWNGHFMMNNTNYHFQDMLHNILGDQNVLALLSSTNLLSWCNFAVFMPS
jgi:hypothetical protein